MFLWNLYQYSDILEKNVNKVPLIFESFLQQLFIDFICFMCAFFHQSVSKHSFFAIMARKGLRSAVKYKNNPMKSTRIQDTDKSWSYISTMVTRRLGKRSSPRANTWPPQLFAGAELETKVRYIFKVLPVIAREK